MIADTSLHAFSELAPTLTIRQRRVLICLAQYRERYAQWPTAYELYAQMKADGLANDLNDVRPRLTELCDKVHRVEKLAKRHCTVTTKLAWTWRPVGPGRLF